jgi:hypothetical protein
LHCPKFPLSSSITPKVSVLRLADTHQQPPAAAAAAVVVVVVVAAAAAAATTASQADDPPLVLFQGVFYIQWQTKRWSHSSQEGCDIITGETCDHYSLNVKAAVLHFSLAFFCGWGHANSACGLFDIAVLMSSSHGFLILCPPQFSKANVIARSSGQWGDAHDYL